MPDASLLLVARRTAHLQPFRALLANEPDIRIAGDALSLRETFNKTEELDPDLVLISTELTAEPEFEAIMKLFAALDTRWLEFTPPGAAPTASGSARAARPSDLFRLAPGDSGSVARAQIRSVLSRPRHRRAPAVQPAPAVPQRIDRQNLVLIGSSTGGVEALMTILATFPADGPPTAIVQHTGQGYGESLARLLDRNCRAEVVQAADRMPLAPGRVVLAAGCGAHMELVPGTSPTVRLRTGAPVSGHCPSVDVMFGSALSLARRVVGVLLTGMGSDGAQGLLKLRKAGACTLVQDEASSLVYGMPKAAWNSGAAVAQMHIDKLGPEILRRARAESTAADRAV